MAQGENHVSLETQGNLVGVSFKLDESSNWAEVGPKTPCMNDLKNAEPQSEDRGAGPWMMVTRKKKSTKAAPPKNNWKSSFVKPFVGLHGGHADGVGSSRFGTFAKHQKSSFKLDKNKGSSSPVEGIEIIHCTDSVRLTETKNMEHWNGGSLDSGGRQFETKCVQVLIENELKPAEPLLKEGQSIFNNLVEGHADSTNSSDMSKDSIMEKMEEVNHVGDGHVNEQQHVEFGMEGMQPIFPSFSAVSVTAKARSKGGKTRGAKKEKMACELGPIAPGSRKRRKAQSLTDGGDASPSSPK